MQPIQPERLIGSILEEEPPRFPDFLSRPLVPQFPSATNRSSSAPPNIIEQEQAGWFDFSDVTENDIDIRMDPNYYTYYYSHKPLDHRLPPPLFSSWGGNNLREVQSSNQRLPDWSNNSTASHPPEPAPGFFEGGNSRMHSFFSLNTETETDLGDPQSLAVPVPKRNPEPASESTSAGVGPLLLSHSLGASWASIAKESPSLSVKSPLEKIQHDFPRTPSPIFASQHDAKQISKPSVFSSPSGHLVSPLSPPDSPSDDMGHLVQSSPTITSSSPVISPLHGTSSPPTASIVPGHNHNSYGARVPQQSVRPAQDASLAQQASPPESFGYQQQQQQRFVAQPPMTGYPQQPLSGSASKPPPSSYVGLPAQKPPGPGFHPGSKPQQHPSLHMQPYHPSMHSHVHHQQSSYVTNEELSVLHGQQGSMIYFEAQRMEQDPHMGGPSRGPYHLPSTDGQGHHQLTSDHMNPYHHPQGYYPGGPLVMHPSHHHQLYSHPHYPPGPTHGMGMPMMYPGSHPHAYPSEMMHGYGSMAAKSPQEFYGHPSAVRPPPTAVPTTQPPQQPPTVAAHVIPTQPSPTPTSAVPSRPTQSPPPPEPVVTPIAQNSRTADSPSPPTTPPIQSSSSSPPLPGPSPPHSKPQRIEKIVIPSPAIVLPPPSTTPQPARSSLLEEFRAAKNGRKFELSDIYGCVVEFSGDQHGSRFIQQKLETATPAEKEAVFQELLPHALTLMIDVFGNYVIQKFFEHGTPSQQQTLGQLLLGNVLSLSLQIYGCRVIQKALEVINVEQKALIVRELGDHVMKCVRDQNGNHVIQKCIECVPPHLIQFVVDSFTGKVFDLSTHPYGCRVIQRILEHCTDAHADAQHLNILHELLEYAVGLVQDQYGNYVIQHVLVNGAKKHKLVVIQKLRTQFAKLSQHKFASNVVEKCVQYADPPNRNMIIEELIGANQEPAHLITIMKDQYANYVVQKILDYVDNAKREELIARIRPLLPALRKYPYAKHIVARVEKESAGK